MFFSEYESLAKKTDQKRDLLVSTTGLAYETGSILSAYQINKIMKGQFAAYRDQVKEDLGDILWYINSISSICHLNLANVSLKSINKSRRIYKQYRMSDPLVGPRLDTNDMGTYQCYVSKTDLKRNETVSVLGLVGETGDVCDLLKKVHRGDMTHEGYIKKIGSELADVLWYLTSIASTHNLTLVDIAKHNLTVIDKRWADLGKPVDDSRYEEDERFPEMFEVSFVEKDRGDKARQVLLQINGVNIGDRLTDNTYKDDGYRYHDAFHLAHVAILGWSPVMRALLKRKRKGNHEVDEVEDGARAAAIEEAVTIDIFNSSKPYKRFKHAEYVDDSILHRTQAMCRDLEVKTCTAKRWERAILDGYKVFHALRSNKGGVVQVDRNASAIMYRRHKSK